MVALQELATVNIQGSGLTASGTVNSLKEYLPEWLQFNRQVSAHQPGVVCCLCQVVTVACIRSCSGSSSHAPLLSAASLV